GKDHGVGKHWRVRRLVAAMVFAHRCTGREARAEARLERVDKQGRQRCGCRGRVHNRTPAGFTAPPYTGRLHGWASVLLRLRLAPATMARPGLAMARGPGRTRCGSRRWATWMN